MPPKGKTELAHPEAADWVLGILGPEQAEDFQRHLTGCLHCQAAVAEFGQIGQMLRRLPPAVEPPEDLEARTIAAVTAKAAFEQAPTRVHQVPEVSRPAAGPQAAPAVPTPVSPPEPAQGQAQDDRSGGGPATIIRFPRWRPSARLLAIVGAVAAAIIAALVILPSLGRGGLGEAVTFNLVSPSGDAASGTATARPDASGSWDITLTVHHLRHFEDNPWYECWYVAQTPQGLRVASAGTFLVGKNGSGTFSMTSAVDPSQFRTMEITIESPTPTGAFSLKQVVLTSRKL